MKMIWMLVSCEPCMFMKMIWVPCMFHVSLVCSGCLKILCMILKSTWIKSLNINAEKVGNKLEFIGIGDRFLSRPPIAQALG